MDRIQLTQKQKTSYRQGRSIQPQTYRTARQPRKDTFSTKKGRTVYFESHVSLMGFDSVPVPIGRLGVPEVVVVFVHTGDSEAWSEAVDRLETLLMLRVYNLMPKEHIKKVLLETMREFYVYDRDFEDGKRFRLTIDERFMCKVLNRENIRLYSNGAFA